MSSNGSDIEDEVVRLLFFRALPEEYSVFSHMQDDEREKLTIDWPRTGLRATRGEILLIEGIGDILLHFRFDSEAFDVQLLNVPFIPRLSHNLLLQQFTSSHLT